MIRSPAMSCDSRVSLEANWVMAKRRLESAISEMNVPSEEASQGCESHKAGRDMSGLQSLLIEIADSLL